jgi:HEAT repeat protein
VTAEHQIAFFLRELSAPVTANRVAAVKGLGRIGQPEHARALLAAAGDAEPTVRAAAAAALGRLGDAGVAGVTETAGVAGVTGTAGVLIGLMADADPQVRRRAAVAADRLALTGPAVIDSFGRLLRDEDWHVRLSALIGLRRLRAPGDIEAVFPLLADPDPIVWGHARDLVRALRDDDAALTAMLRTARDGHGAARARVLELLPARCTAQLRDSLLDGLRDPDPGVREAVVDRLAEDPEPGTGGALLAALETERDPNVVRRLLNALGQRREHGALPAAMRWFDDPNVAPAAVSALASIGTPEAVRQIRSALIPAASRPWVREAAARAIGGLGDRDDVGRLLPLLRDWSPGVRAGAVEGLGQLGKHRLPRGVRHAVAKALTDHLVADRESIWLTRNAVCSYHAEAMPLIRRLVDDAQGETRAAALSLLGDADAGRFLAHLDDPHDSVRMQAAYGLRRYAEKHHALPRGGADRLDVLRALAADQSSRAQWAAAEVLDALRRPGLTP